MQARVKATGPVTRPQRSVDERPWRRRRVAQDQRRGRGRFSCCPRSSAPRGSHQVPSWW